MIKKKYILILFAVLSWSGIVAQDENLKVGQHYEPVYSQYWVNGLAINPAYTGSQECFSNIILTRNQWVGFDGAPVTQTLSSHAPFKDEKMLQAFLFFMKKLELQIISMFLEIMHFVFN